MSPKSERQARKSAKKKLHLRSKYLDHTLQFLNWVDAMGFHKSPLGAWLTSMERRFRLRYFLALFVFSWLLGSLLYLNLDFPYKVGVGEVAIRGIQSPISFQILDKVATTAKEVEAIKVVPHVYDYDPEAYETIYVKIYRGFRLYRNRMNEFSWPKSSRKQQQLVKKLLKTKSDLDQILGVNIEDSLFEWLTRNQFSIELEDQVLEILSHWSNSKMVDLTSFNSELSGVTVREVNDGKATRENLVGIDGIKNIRSLSDFNLTGAKGVLKWRKKDRLRLLSLSKSFLIPNLTLNKQETESRKAKARESVPSVIVSVKKDQTIVASGSVVLPIHVTLLDEIQKLQEGRRTDSLAILSGLFFVFLVLVFFSFLRRFTANKVKVKWKDAAVMATVTLIVTVIVKLFLFITHASFISRFGSIIPNNVFLYAAPVAAAPMLVGLLITYGEVVWLFTTFLAVVLSFMVGVDIDFLIVTIVGGVAGARGVHACRARNDVYLAGIRTGLVNSVAVFLLLMLRHIGGEDLIKILLWNVPAAFIGGIGSSMVAMIFVPILESVFNCTTDVKLLELSNLNHPLMKELMMKAPGTYHHSMAVGTMVDGAADDIGANALMGKVMAYYHDIGKMEHSQYFVENQRRGYNPHDHISPFMSKTILISHVKDGAEMGLKHKLGKPIIDGILQHHGTTMITYFYNKAVDSQDKDLGQVDPNEFRYPGPKPQFKEAGLLMLADSIEAAARSMEEPTPIRLQNLVKNIIQSKFVDGQLNECDLTLRELSKIESSFKKILLGIYHQRMEYPHLRDGKNITQKESKNPGLLNTFNGHSGGSKNHSGDDRRKALSARSEKVEKAEKKLHGK